MCHISANYFKNSFTSILGWCSTSSDKIGNRISCAKSYFLACFVTVWKTAMFFFPNVSGGTAQNIKPMESLSEGLCVSRYLKSSCYVGWLLIILPVKASNSSTCHEQPSNVAWLWFKMTKLLSVWSVLQSSEKRNCFFAEVMECGSCL